MFIKLIRNILSDLSGNVGAIFAVMAVPVMIIIGGSIDILRISNSQAKLQAAVEAGVLAAASLSSTQSVEDAVNDYIMSNLGDDATIENLKISVENANLSLNKRVVEVKAEAEVPLSFLQFTGSTVKKIEVTAEAVEAQQTMELSMVLDISSSMHGQRLSNLKSAASDFVDQILTEKQKDLTSISLVPFGGTVNLGPIFNDYVVDGSGVTYNPNQGQYNKGYAITSKKFRFSDGDNCIELRKEDFDLDSIPSKSRSQIPHFWKWWNFNPWCPDAASAAMWNTNKADDLKTRIAGMTLSDGTGMDHGILWGAKALSPSFKGKLGGDFPQRPNAFNDPDEDVQKIMVLMTDGGITFQGRPKNPAKNNVHTNRNSNNDPSTGIPNQGNNKNQQTLLSRGKLSNSAGHNTAIGNFKAVCDDLEEKGVVIYTIGFQIKKNSLPENLLKYCATNPANYFLVESLDISKAFNAIAVSVQKLRVSG